MADIKKIIVDDVEYDIKDASIPTWARSEQKPSYKTSELDNDLEFTTKDELHTHENKNILDGITQNDINRWNSGTGDGTGGYYELPVASSETLGGIKVGDNLSIDENGVLSANASGSGSSLDAYSTEEQVIGTWVDGKPLYRKVVQYTLTATSGYPTVDTGIRDIDYAMIDMYRSDGGDSNTNYFRSTSSIAGYLAKSSGIYTFILDNASGDFKAAPGLYTFIIKYTKTTN